MEFNLLVRGAVIGLSIAAPVGPIGVLCIRRTLADGRLYGLVAGLGAATADAVYRCIAAFGMSAVMGPLVHQQDVLRVAGGLFLCYLGVKTALSRPAERAAATRGSGLLWAYLSTLLLTLTNPMSILAFAAIFAGLGASGTRQGLGSALTMVAGVFLGSVAWWAAAEQGDARLAQQPPTGAFAGDQPAIGSNCCRIRPVEPARSIARGAAPNRAFKQAVRRAIMSRRESPWNSRGAAATK